MAQKPLTAEETAVTARRLPAPEPLGALYIAGLGLLLSVGPAAAGALPPGVWPIIPLLMGTAVPLLWVSRAPMRVLLLVIALQTLVFTVFDGFRLPDAEFAFIAVLIALGAVASRRSLWMSLLALLLSWSGIAAAMLFAFPGTDVVWVLQSTTAMCLLAWGLGVFARASRLRVGRLQTAQDLAERAVVDERARIARELNDIIRGDVDRMRRSAAVAREEIAEDHARAATAFAAIEAVGVEAMNELRRLLHVLRDDPSLAVDDLGGRDDEAGREPFAGLFRFTRADVVGAAVAILGTVVLTALSLTGPERWAASVYFAVTLLVLLWRRRYPVAVFALVIAGHAGAVLIFHDGDFVWDTFTAMVPVLVALFAVAAGRSPWISVPVLVVAGGYLAVPGLAYPTVLAQNVTTYVLVVVTVWAAGAYAGRRRRQIEDLEKDQDAAAHAVARERARLAYDLHDVIGHAITIMVVQAAGAARIMDRDPARALAALGAVERAGSEAVVELEHLVEVLSEAGAASSGAAGGVSGMADVGELVERARGAVGHLSFDVRGAPVRLEPSVDVAAYCVVREALANAAKHDGAEAEVHVELSWEAHRVGIRVVSRRSGDEPPHATELSSGYGLAGVRERVRVAGGEISWSPEGDAFVVTAALPTAAAG